MGQVQQAGRAIASIISYLLSAPRFSSYFPSCWFFLSFLVHPIFAFLATRVFSSGVVGWWAFSAAVRL